MPSSLIRQSTFTVRTGTARRAAVGTSTSAVLRSREQTSDPRLLSSLRRERQKMEPEASQTASRTQQNPAPNVVLLMRRYRPKPISPALFSRYAHQPSQISFSTRLGRAVSRAAPHATRDELGGPSSAPKPKPKGRVRAVLGRLGLARTATGRDTVSGRPGSHCDLGASSWAVILEMHQIQLELLDRSSCTITRMSADFLLRLP